MKKKICLILPIVFLAVLVALFNSSYAIYSTNAAGDANINTAAWVVYVNDIDMVQNKFFSINTNDIVIDNSNAHAKDGTIAPGSVMTIPLLIDGSDAEVPVDYIVEIGDPYIYSSDDIIGSVNSQTTYIDVSDAVSISVTSGSLTGTINQTSNDTSENIELELEWLKASDGTSNSRDMSMESETIYVPITVTASQHITTQSP